MTSNKQQLSTQYPTEKLAELYRSGTSRKQLSKLTGHALATITRRLASSGVTIRTPHETVTNRLTISDNDKQRINELYESGHTRAEITAMGYTEWAVRLAVRRFRTIAEANELAAYKHSSDFTAEQAECVLGTLLGDSSLLARRNTYCLQVSHGPRQLPYLQHLADVLQAPRQIRKIVRNNAFGKIIYQLQYENKRALSPIAALALRNAQKTVNAAWLSRITPRSLAYWFMDDGTSSWHKSGSTCRFCTNSYNVLELCLLMSLLASYGITATPCRASGGFVLNVAKRSINRVFDIVEPYVVPCLRYKVKRS